MIIKPCMGSTLSLESYLIFINPQFMLYHAPINSSIIFPTQLDRFMKKLNLSSSIINGSHNILSDKLISQHKTDCPFSRIPLYDSCSFFIRTRFCHYSILILAGFASAPVFLPLFHYDYSYTNQYAWLRSK